MKNCSSSIFYGSLFLLVPQGAAGNQLRVVILLLLSLSFQSLAPPASGQCFKKHVIDIVDDTAEPRGVHS